MNCRFYLNDAALENDVGNRETSALHSGDYLVASVNKDDTYYADHYTSFAKRSSTATVAAKFTIHLSGVKNSDSISIGYWENGKFTAISGASVDANGNVSLTFDKAGAYLLTAQGTVRDTVQNWNAGGAAIEADCPIIAPGCQVRVSAASTGAKAERLEISGDFKKTYAVGDRMDLSGMTLTVHYSDGTSREVAADDASITGFDTATRGEKTITVSAEGVSNTFVIHVTKAAGTIDVTLSILGDSKHGSGKTHTLAKGGLTTWVKATTWNVKSNSTVWDVLKQCLNEQGMKYSNASGNYVSSVNGLSEFDNGKNSGWMYTLNGKYPLLGVSEQKLKDGDRIVFHYTDDYTLENTGFHSPTEGEGDAEDAEKDMMVDAVEKMIANIGAVSFDASCKAKIAAARKAYNKLSVEQKRKVENYKDLQAAEKTYADLEKQEDQAKADEVIRRIEEMGDDGDKIAAARAAYDALTEAQKKLVSNYRKLTEAEYRRAYVVSTDADRSGAQGVIDQITAIGDWVYADSEAKIAAARSGYDALTDVQKALVTNYARLTAAEEANARLKALADFEAAYAATGDLLEKMVTPQVGSVGGEWMVIGLARSGRSVCAEYYERVLDFISENIDEHRRLNPNKATDNARLILALTAMGEDVHNVGGYDLTAGLSQMEYIEKQGINGSIWTLIALDSNAYEFSEGDVSREALVASILDAQLEDGGWTLAGENADADMTGMALQALAPYYDEDADADNELNASIERGVECLSMLQLSDGSFGAYGADGEIVATAESISQAIVALTALNIDPDTDERFVKNGVSALDALLAFALPEGGFCHSVDGERDSMATEQGYYALVAYARNLAGMNRLYDMTDAFVEAESEVQPHTLCIWVSEVN